MNSVIDIEFTKKYGSQLLDIIEKQVNAKIKVLIPFEGKTYVFDKKEYVELCEQMKH